MINRNPNTTAKNFPAGLPKVSGGQPTHPTHINKLSESVARNQIRSVTGGLVSQTGGGSVISIPDQQSGYEPPFRVSVVGGDHLAIKSGYLMLGGYDQCKVQQYFPKAGDTEQIYRGGEYRLPDDAYSFYDTTKSLKDKTSGDADAGKIVIPMGDLSEAPKCVWMDFGGAPTLRYSTTPSDTVGVPIAWVFDGGKVIQLVNSGIAKPLLPPLYGYCTTESYDSEDENGTPTKANGVFFRMVWGTVKYTVPTINGKELSHKDAREYIDVNSDKTWYLYLVAEVSDSENEPFPKTVKLEKSDEPPTNDGTNGICLAAQVVVSNKRAVCYPALAGSLWVEAHQYKPDWTTFFFYRL